MSVKLEAPLSLRGRFFRGDDSHTGTLQAPDRSSIIDSCASSLAHRVRRSIESARASLAATLTEREAEAASL